MKTFLTSFGIQGNFVMTTLPRDLTIDVIRATLSSLISSEVLNKVEIRSSNWGLAATKVGRHLDLDALFAPTQPDGNNEWMNELVAILAGENMVKVWMNWRGWNGVGREIFFLYLNIEQIGGKSGRRWGIVGAKDIWGFLYF